MSSVEEDANIRILDPRKLDAEGRKAVAEMERIRKRLEAEAKKADKAVDQVLGGPADILNKQLGRTGTPGKVLPSSGLAQGKAPIERSAPFKDLRAEVKRLKEEAKKRDARLDGTIDKLSDVQSAINDPINLIFGKFRGKIPQLLLKGGIIGTIVLAVSQQIFQIIKDSFAPGGINDIRKQILDEAATIPDLENLIAIRNGSVFFTADTRVRQKVAQSSNTEDLDAQSQRFNLFALGRDISAT